MSKDKKKKYNTQATKFFGFDETLELDAQELEENLPVEEEEEEEETLDVEKTQVFEVNKISNDDTKYYYDDNFDYHNYDDAQEDEEEYGEEDEPKAKLSKRNKIIILASALTLLLVALIFLIIMLNSEDYLEDVEVYVDNTLVDTFDRVVEDELQDELVQAGYDKENYIIDDKVVAEKNKVYLLQKKDITITYSSAKLDDSPKEIYQYKLDLVLVELGIQVDDNTVIYLDNSKIDPTNYSKTNVRNGANIRVIESVTREETVEEEIPFNTDEQKDTTLEEGERVVSVKGEVGTRQIKYSIKYVDGKEVSREVISTKVTKEPVDEIILIGTKQPEKENNKWRD